MKMPRSRALDGKLEAIFMRSSPSSPSSVSPFQAAASRPIPAAPSGSRAALFLPYLRSDRFRSIPFTERSLPIFRSFSSVPEKDLELPEKQNQDDLLAAQQQEKQGRVIPVKAYFIGTSVSLKSLQSQNAYNVIPPHSRAAANYMVLKYYDTKLEPHDSELGFKDERNCHYMVVFQYGSVVLFNVSSDSEAEGYLKIVERYASGLLPEVRKDDYTVVENPSLETWMQGGLDYIVLKNLSIDGIRTIGSVLGQSIALDHYIQQVDEMMAEFIDINCGMEKTGTFTMRRKKLFQLVGKANSNLTDVILKLGLFERLDVAWKKGNYAQIWEYLQEEYELSQRFGSLDYKLKFVERNIHFLQDILQNRRSDSLEWLIIILISVEILISVFHYS